MFLVMFLFWGGVITPTCTSYMNTQYTQVHHAPKGATTVQHAGTMCTSFTVTFIRLYEIYFAKETHSFPYLLC
jgi:hypothetical protein